jgi:hemoglobin/transferrin/lactoferrin receptor protein
METTPALRAAPFASRRSLLTSACLLAVPAFAAPTPAPDPNSPDTLDRMIVSARKTDETVGEASATVSVIDEEEMRRRLVRDLSELLRYEPGVSVANEANRFGLGDVRIRGLGGNRVAIEVDGVAINDAFAIGSFSSAGRDAVDVHTLKQVEVLRGPASSLYGSDALGGVLSFVTKDPLDYLYGDDVGHVQGRLGYSGVDNGRHVGTTTVLRQGAWSMLFNTTHRSGQEGDNQGTIDSQDASRTLPNPQDYSDDALLAKLVYTPRPNDALRLTFDGRIARTDTDVLSARRTQALGPSQIRTDDLRAEDRADRRRISLDYQLGNALGWVDQANVQVYAQDSSNKQQTFERRSTISAAGASPTERYRLFDFEQRLRGLELTGRSDFDLGASSHRLVYGLDYAHTDTDQLRDGFQRNPITGAVTNAVLPDVFPVRDFPPSETRELGLYLQDRIGLLDDRLSVIPALRVDRYELEPKPDAIFVEDNPGVATVGLNETELSPKLGLAWTLNQHWSLHGQYSEGFRAPPYNDVNIGFTNFAFGYTALPNPDLKAETSRGVEFGLRGQADWGYVAVTAYRNDYDDFIESLLAIGVDPQTGLLLFQSQNLDDVRIEGVEARAAFELGQLSASLANFRFNLAYAQARGDVTSSDTPLNSVDPAELVVGLGWAHPEGHLEIDLIGTGVRRKSRLDDDSLFAPPGHAVFDLLATWHINELLRIDAGVFNLTDKRYWRWADVQGRPAADPALERYTRAGRNLSLNLSLEW